MRGPANLRAGSPPFGSCRFWQGGLAIPMAAALAQVGTEATKMIRPPEPVLKAARQKRTVAYADFIVV